jgi:hypothetical protein
MRRLLAIVVGLVLVLGASRGSAAAQTTPAGPAAEGDKAQIIEVHLTDGSVLYGTVVSDEPARVVFRTLAGAMITLERGQIVTIGPARGRVVNGEFYRADSNGTRLFFAPTGRSLPKGQGYVGVYEFLLPFVQVGVTDRLSLGVGTPLLFFGDEDVRPVWFTPKYQVYRSERVNAAIGVMHFVVFGDDTKMGLAYGVTTVGNDDRALTVGAGWAYARYQDTEYGADCFGPGPPRTCAGVEVTKTPGSPVLMLGGERRISRRLKLISENYVFESGGLVSAGVRFLGERLTADFGFFSPLSAEELFVAPVINFVWTFGQGAVR